MGSSVVYRNFLGLVGDDCLLLVTVLGKRALLSSPANTSLGRHGVGAILNYEEFC